MQRRTFLISLIGAPTLASCATGLRPGGEFSTPLAFDNEGRPVVDVMVNRRGPFTFVVDTAAQRTGLSQNLIAELALAPTEHGGRLQGSSGAHSVSLYRLDHIEMAGLTREQVGAAPLLHTHTSNARGIVGADAFFGRRVTFDFARRLLRIETSEASQRHNWRSTAIELRYATFALAPVNIGSIAATAVIDTGATRTIGNTALLEALGSSVGLRDGEPIVGVAGGSARTRIGRASNLTMIGEDVGGADIAFGAFPVFTALHLDDGPAIILGTDVLRRFDAIAIDYQASIFGVLGGGSRRSL